MSFASRQRIAWNDAEIVVAGLEKAVEKLDLEAFEEQLSKAKKLLGARKLPPDCMAIGLQQGIHVYRSSYFL